MPPERFPRGAVTAVPAGSAGHPRIEIPPEPPAARAPADGGEPLSITVTNGDLTFEPRPLLLGHYRSTRLTGTERVMNRAIGGAMEHSLEVGLYPGPAGSHQIFINTRSDLERCGTLPRPRAVIVAGLGDEGKLQPAHLVQTVRQAVIAWVQRVAEANRTPPAVELAATLIGSGGARMTAGESARLVVQGVYEANELLKDEHTGDWQWPLVRHLHLIELYLDRAADAWRSLRLQAAATPGRYDIADAIQTGTGALLRPLDSGYRGADYDFISVETRQPAGGAPQISYTLDTRRARSEVHAQRAQSQLLTELVNTASNEQNRDAQIGRTLFNLLIPIELEAYLSASDEMQIQLDPGTARIPWELLDTNNDDTVNKRPWAIRVKLLRKLRTDGFRDHVLDADPDASALVIGEPECPEGYPRLYGARAEAEAVRECLTGPAALESASVKSLIADDPSDSGADARTVINALFERPWRIVHITGHGALPENGTPGGVVLSNGSFLGPDEMRSMRSVPELVFVNCCHLAGSGEERLLKPAYDRVTFASGVAGALIGIGVRCVIAAGWAVDDADAGVFAETFYESLMRGNRFIVAVGEARESTYNRSPPSNTWAAYQCYGDPDWVFRRKPFEADRFTAPLPDDYSNIASATSLKLALERIVVQTKYQGRDPAEQRENVHMLERLFGTRWGSSGSVAELFGEAFVEAGAIERGLTWYTRAVSAPDAKASMKAAEQLANVRSRRAWEIVDTAQRYCEAARRDPASGALADATQKFRAAHHRALQLIRDSVQLLAKLRAVDTTMERESLVGSAYKRLALVEQASGRARRAEQALLRMKKAYDDAQGIGRQTGARDLFYPASNGLVAEIALNAGRRGWPGFDPAAADVVRNSLAAKNRTDADFWSVVGAIELQQYEAIIAGDLASRWEGLEIAHRDLYERVKATRMWSSVYDTACLVLRSYAERAQERERDTAIAALKLLQTFAHPEEH